MPRQRRLETEVFSSVCPGCGIDHSEMVERNGGPYGMEIHCSCGITFSALTGNAISGRRHRAFLEAVEREYLAQLRAGRHGNTLDKDQLTWVEDVHLQLDRALGSEDFAFRMVEAAATILAVFHAAADRRQRGVDPIPGDSFFMELLERQVQRQEQQERDAVRVTDQAVRMTVNGSLIASPEQLRELERAVAGTGFALPLTEEPSRIRDYMLHRTPSFQIIEEGNMVWIQTENGERFTLPDYAAPWNTFTPSRPPENG
jgi:hypothetical protein